MKEVHIWNVKFNILDIEEFVSTVDIWLSEGRKGIHLTGVDYNVVVLAQEDELLRHSIEDSDLVNVDAIFRQNISKRQAMAM